MNIVWVSRKFTRQEAALNTLPENETVLVVDLDRCIACGSCQYACRIEHAAEGLPTGGPLAFCADVKGADRAGAGVRLPLSCRRCATPCRYFDPNNFWVTCPSGTPRPAALCDSCAERAASGLMPACATRCSMKCIYFGHAGDMAFVLDEKRLRNMGDVMLACRTEKKHAARR